MAQKKETYLEISPRQTGKTTRLVQAVIDHVIEGHDAFVLDAYPAHLWQCLAAAGASCVPRKHRESDGSNPGTVYKIRHQSELYINWESSESDFPKPKGLDSNRFRGLTFNNPRLFVDNVSDIMPGYLPIIEGSYYASHRMVSPDIFKLTGYQYTSYVPFNVPVEPRSDYDLWPPGGGAIQVRSTGS